MANLVIVVADPQHGCAPAAAVASGAATAGLPMHEPILAEVGDLPDADAHTEELPHGSEDNGDAFLHRGKTPVATPAPFPGTAEFPFQSLVSVVIPSPLAHASQLLVGWVKCILPSVSLNSLVKIESSGKNYVSNIFPCLQ